MKFNPKKKYINVALALLLSVIFVEVGVSALKFPAWNIAGFISPSKELSLEEYADTVLEKCSSVDYRPACYDEEVPKLMDVISMEDAFRVTWFIQEKDRAYHYCHVLGHNLSAREVQKDPANWKEAVSRCPSGMCSNGCLHGGFQERFRADFLTDVQIVEIKPDLESLCEERDNWHPTRLEQASCYHALGHLTMYITNADLPKANRLCEDITIKSDGRDFSHLCFDGAFMQIFQPLEPEDFALVEGKQPTKEEVPSFCREYEDEKQASCLSESWPLFWEDLQKPEGLVKFCSMTEPEGRARCYNALSYVMSAQFKFDLEKIQNYCAGLPEDIRWRCFANSSSRMIETDYRNIGKSVELCLLGKPHDGEGRCFQELILYSTYNFHPGSEEFFKLCNGLPEPWKTKCLEGS